MAYRDTTQEYNSDFYLRLKDLCRQHGESIRSMCEKNDISVATSTRWRRGSNPDVKTLKKIADFFSISIDDLVGYKPANTSILNHQEYELVRVYNIMTDEDRRAVNAILNKYRAKVYKTEKSSDED